MLANAIYFNAAWQLPFDERATAPGPFHPLGGGYIEASMMRQEGETRLRARGRLSGRGTAVRRRRDGHGHTAP